jgi:hypothetical protein
MWEGSMTPSGSIVSPAVALENSLTSAVDPPASSNGLSTQRRAPSCDVHHLAEERHRPGEDDAIAAARLLGNNPAAGRSAEDQGSANPTREALWLRWSLIHRGFVARIHCVDAVQH